MPIPSGYTSGQVVQAVPTGINSALVRVGGGALSGSSTAFASVFSATYDAYQIVVSNVQTSAVDAWLALQLGSTITGYYGAASTANFATGNYTGGINFSNTSNFQYVFAISNPATNINGGSVTLFNPFQTKRTTMSGFVARLNTAGYAGAVGGFQDSDTSFTGFTLIPSTGTMTGTCNIYGYTLS